MRFATVFGLYGVVLALAATATPWIEAVFLGWAAVSCLLVAGAYAMNRPRLLGKRDDGTVSPLALVALVPYLAVQAVVWRLATRLRPAAAACEVAAGLHIGRRPLAHEVPCDVRSVIDLTAEFGEPRGVSTGRRYVCLPTLDGTAPGDAELDRVVEDLAARREPALVHCANGHGRSALVVACTLVARGDAADADDAMRRVRAVRHRARLNSIQKAALARHLERRGVGRPTSVARGSSVR